ncbi:MAG: acyl carrier protein [Patescibacteria group bacterium]
MKKEDIFSKLCEILANLMLVDHNHGEYTLSNPNLGNEKVTIETSLKFDLVLDSLDEADFINEIEKAFLLNDGDLPMDGTLDTLGKIVDTIYSLKNPN